MKCHLQKITFYYEIVGEGSPVLMLHGFSPDHRLMSGCMEPVFRNRNEAWQRIYVDLPGMGKTEGNAWIKTSDDMLDLLLEFIDTVIPNQRMLLVGESYGGYLARGLLARRAAWVDGLLLLCPCIIADATQRILPPVTVLVEDPVFMSGLQPEEAEAFGEVAIVQDQTNWERFRDEILPGLQIADYDFLNSFREQGGYSFSFDVDQQMTTFNKPTLIVTGRQDFVVGYQDAWSLLKNYPRATFAVLDRAGHNLQIEQARVFNALVHEWLDRVKESFEQ